MISIKSNDIENIYEYLTSKLDDSFAIFLKLNSSKATQIIFYDKELKYVLSFEPFYVDKFGDKDLWMSHG